MNKAANLIIFLGVCVLFALQYLCVFITSKHDLVSIVNLVIFSLDKSFYNHEHRDNFYLYQIYDLILLLFLCKAARLQIRKGVDPEKFILVYLFIIFKQYIQAYAEI